MVLAPYVYMVHESLAYTLICAVCVHTLYVQWHQMPKYISIFIYRVLVSGRGGEEVGGEMGRSGRGDGRVWEGRDGKEWEGRWEGVGGEVGRSERGDGKEWEGRWEGVGGEMGRSGRGDGRVWEGRDGKEWEGRWEGVGGEMGRSGKGDGKEWG